MASSSAYPAPPPPAPPHDSGGGGSDPPRHPTANPPSPSKGQTVRDVLTCGLCHQLLRDPWALPCFHNFCHACLPRLNRPPAQPTNPATSGGASGGGGGVSGLAAAAAAAALAGAGVKNGTGLHCAVCETYAKPHQCSKNYLISELLVLYKLQQSRSGPCSQCGLTSVPLEWLCVQCKLGLCSGCRERHLAIPVCRAHTVLPLSADSAHLRLDSAVACQLHPDKVLSLCCATCEAVICRQCQLTQHDTHDCVPVTTALARTVSTIRANLRKIADNDKTYQEDMYRVDAELDNMSTQFLATIAQLTRAKERLIHKINKDYALLVLDLQSRKKAEMLRLNRLKYQLASKMRIRENLVAWMSTCLKLAKGTSLLIELHANLQERVAQFAASAAGKVDFGEHCSPMFVSRPESFSTHDNLLGQIMYTPANYPVPHDFQLPFRVLLNKELVSEQEFQTSGMCYQLALVNNALWVPLSNKHTIDVFTLSGQPVTSITHEDIREPLAVAQVRDPDVVVASCTGLYLLDAVSGTIQTRLQEGSFCYVHTNGEIFAVLEYKSKTVYIYHWYGPSLQWRIHKEMNFNVPGMGCLSTVLVCDTSLFLCPWDGQTIYKYSFNGDLKARYLNAAREGGQLDYPRLCGVDREGAVLVVDEHYQRLQLLTPDGKWRELAVPGTSNPAGVLVLNNSTLFVLDKLGEFSTRIIRYHIPP